MKNTFFMIISFFLPLAIFKLFADANPSMAQPQQGAPRTGQPQGGQAQGRPFSIQDLDKYALPSGPVTENDVPKIKSLIRQALEKISASKKSAGNTADIQTIKSCILTFQEWQKEQKCIIQASTTYDLEATDKYSENIFITYPGQLPFDIVFNMEGDIKKPYRMLLFVSMVDLLKLASLVENKSIGGVPFPKNWPKDTWSYWEPRL